MKCTLLLFLTVFTTSLTSCLSPRLLEKKGNVIKLERQGLTEIPESVFLAENVTELHLYGNQLDSLPGRIGELTELKKLYVGKNNLKTLPPEIGQLKKLEVL